MINRLFRRIVVIVISFFLVFPSSLTRAGFEDEMKGLFDSMVNVSEGDYHKAMGRGVVAGPTVVIRNKRIRTDLINFTPPRFDAGCGGIDMFLGSFSFINSQQFIHLLQSIASNAAGYAFKLALSVMCPSCKQVMTNLQRTIQHLNQMAGDSCRAAQFLVNTAADKLPMNELKQQMEQGPLSQAAKVLGQKLDEFDTFLNKVNTGTATGALRGYQVNTLMGNIAWKVLKQNGYIFNSGGDELSEALMSVTGTITGIKPSDEEYVMPKIDKYIPLLSYKDIMEGGGDSNETKKYVCDETDECLFPTPGTYSFKGLKKFVREVLLGSSDASVSSNSLVAQLLTNSGTLSSQAKQLIRVAPYHTTRLRHMAVCTMTAGGVGSLERYAAEASDLIALEVLEKYLRDALSMINQAAGAKTTDVDGMTFPEFLGPEYQEKLRETSKEVKEAHNILSGAKQQTLEQIYQSATASCNLKNLTVRKDG
jgi:conjugative transfer pilus assembly protein TraH